MRDRGWKDKTAAVVRKHRPDYLIALYTGILMLIGLVVIYAIGPQRANVLNNLIGSNFSDSYFFIKQAVSLALAVVAFGLFAFFPYKVVLKYAGRLLIAGLLACTILFIASKAGLPIAEEINGASRWFNLGILGSLQPAEIVKFGLLLYLAVFLGARVKDGRVNDVKATLIPVGILAAITLLFIVVIQRDLGTGIAVTSIVITMLFVAGLNKKNGLALLGALIVGGGLLIFTAPHRVERVVTFLQGDNTSTSDAESYHIEHAKIAIGSGGFTGVGIGNSVQATGYLPEVINDSVFAVLGETFGFVGLIALMAIFVALLLRLLKVLDHLVDARLKLLVAGVFGWFGAHVILNIAAMIGIVPLTGITLPLISFGGTSMIFITAALGLVFQLSRYTVHSSRLKEATGYEDSLSGRRVGRTRYASRRSS
ncbi:FtsW/RodA/SpoVE family cell cycle protein [Candidatus Saccharibacteria bacterium]|nr:FtsW/RodA/SpoVE family cell cycle protein [Candidatus Saccharibacteria bacterium]